jgi:DNA polymerase-3 subunit delta'
MAFLDALAPPLRQNRPVQVLDAALHRGRLAHAIMLQGDHLPLLETVALTLADTLLHANGRPEQHPDLFTLRPAGKARMIRIGERHADEPNTMRHLLHNLQQTSARGSGKVAIIFEADRMNAPTANAFLKTLEEPPPGTVLLLLTTRPYDLVATIRSRCFLFRLPKAAEPGPEPDWQVWLDDYQGWLRSLLAGAPNAAARAQAVMTLYGLLSRFVSHLDRTAAARWKELKQDLPDWLGEEERGAIEVGARKGLRQRLFIDIEETTRMFAIEASHHLPFPAASLARAVDVLEKTGGLLEVNLKEETALEHFMLASLRIWTAEGG